MISIYFLILFVITIGWFIIPLVPAIRELTRPTDTAPLSVVTRESSDIAYFANNFRKYILKNTENIKIDQWVKTTPLTLPDNTPLIMLSGDSQPLAQGKSNTNVVDAVVMVEGKVILPDGYVFKREIYAMDSIAGGEKSAFRAILAENDLLLSKGSIILRWAHSVGDLHVMEDSFLHGRVSSDKFIHLSTGVTFEWVGAPVVSIGSNKLSDRLSPQSNEYVSFNLETWSTLGEGTYKHMGGIHIPDKSLVTGNLVVKGSLTIGSDTIVKGSIKAHETITLEDGVIIEGSIVARSSLSIGKYCKISGVLISESDVIVYQGSTVGSIEKPATISAPRIVLSDGVVVYGMIVANISGNILAVN